MIGGLYNTTSLLIEPTRALGEFVRVADTHGVTPVASQTSFAARGTDAEALPDRLPTGVLNFVPVVLEMLEQHAAEEIAADEIRRELERHAEQAEEIPDAGGGRETAEAATVPPPRENEQAKESSAAAEGYARGRDAPPEAEPELDAFI